MSIIGVTVCSIDGCEHTIANHRGWCDKHYCRWKRHGDPLVAHKRYRTSTDPIRSKRICTKCKETKPLTAFSADKDSGDGVRYRCKECTSEIGKETRDLVKERERSKRYYLKNKEKSKNRLQNWRKNHREYSYARDKKYRESRPDETRAIIKRAYLKERESPTNRICHAITSGIYHSISKGSKFGRTTRALLDFSFEDLKEHLEVQFLPGMSWDNYGLGGWEIDHIVPVSSFSYETPDDPEFKVCWALGNLRPLWARDNRSKGAKICLKSLKGHADVDSFRSTLRMETQAIRDDGLESRRHVQCHQGMCGSGDQSRRSGRTAQDVQNR